MSADTYSLKISEILLPVLRDLSIMKLCIDSLSLTLIESVFLSVVGLPYIFMYFYVIFIELCGTKLKVVNG